MNSGLSDMDESGRREPQPALLGQTALVTGASRGIGRAAARALAALGARVAVAARSEGPLRALAEEIGGWALPGDGTTPAGVDRWLDGFRALAGGDPDILVTSAGVFTMASVEETEPDVLAHNLNVNLTASFLAVRGVLPGMRARGSGTIVLVGSVGGRHAFPGNAAYSASKFGLRGFHEVLLQETRGSGVRVTLLEPAATDTPIWDPMDPDRDPNLPSRDAMLRPEDVADALSFIVTRPAGVRIPFLPIERA
jgi:NAD(P)-dependent dehydrogenase (short-subunit alcohol dehydrogenase family)